MELYVCYPLREIFIICNESEVDITTIIKLFSCQIMQVDNEFIYMSILPICEENIFDMHSFLMNQQYLYYDMNQKYYYYDSIIYMF